MKNTLHILFVVIFSSVYGCSAVDTGAGMGEFVNIEKMEISANDENLQLQDGLLLYNKIPFTGIVIEVNEGGDTIFTGSYYMGKEHGIMKKWYDNGQLKEERSFLFGRKEGTHTGWYEDGSQRFVYNFDHGEYSGNLKEWYQNGQLYKDFNYVNGYETGMQTAWETNGKLLANYEVKNGRKYGLIGTHNCKSLWDDKENNYESNM